MRKYFGKDFPPKKKKETYKKNVWCFFLKTVYKLYCLTKSHIQLIALFRN